MQLFVHLLQALTRGVAVFVLLALLSTGSLLYAVSSHITNVDTVEGWLERADVYANVLNELPALIERDTSFDTATVEQSLDQNPYLSEEDITATIQQVITPDVLQAETEVVVQGVYAWLEGETSSPEFEASLAAQQQPLAEALGETLRVNLAELPPCGAEQLEQDFDLIASNCLPSGVNLDREIDRFVAEFTGSDGLLADATLSGDDLNLSAEQLEQGPGCIRPSFFGGLGAYRRHCSLLCCRRTAAP